MPRPLSAPGALRVGPSPARGSGHAARSANWSLTRLGRPGGGTRHRTRAHAEPVALVQDARREPRLQHRGDHLLVLGAVKQGGRALKYASKELRGDFDVVLEAVGMNGMALRHASGDLCNDRNGFLIEAS